MALCVYEEGQDYLIPSVCFRGSTRRYPLLRILGRERWWLCWGRGEQWSEWTDAINYYTTTLLPKWGLSELIETA